MLFAMLGITENCTASTTVIFSTNAHIPHSLFGFLDLMRIDSCAIGMDRPLGLIHDLFGPLDFFHTLCFRVVSKPLALSWHLSTQALDIRFRFYPNPRTARKWFVWPIYDPARTIDNDLAAIVVRFVRLDRQGRDSISRLLIGFDFVLIDMDDFLQRNS
jgi:hypothetical protein